MVDREDNGHDQLKRRWFVDLGWYDSHNRSFFTLARELLCPKCRRQLKIDEKEAPAAALLKAIKGCCASEPGFITTEMPVLESIFRLLLANGNQPMGLEELGQQLRERFGGDFYRVSLEILPRLFQNDRYYGLRDSGE